MPKVIILFICFLLFAFTGDAQEKKVYITGAQEGNNIVLTAHNTLDQRVRIKLVIKSSGMNLSAGPEITKTLSPQSETKMVTLSPIPGAQASYSYKLSSEILDQGEELEVVRTYTEYRNVVRNTSQYRGEQAKKNVAENMPRETVVVFVKNECPRCDDLIAQLKTSGLSFVMLNVDEDPTTDQLMWDALYAFDVKEGKVLMPTVFDQDRAYYDIQDFPELIQKLKKN